MEMMALHYLIFILAAVALNGMLLTINAANVHYYDFVLKEKNFTRLCSTKAAMVVNESLPGPTVYVNKGDTMYVNVHNHGQYRVTLHWHGVKQPRNPWYDGPEFITQCAIQPGTNFTYEVVFSDEEGTLWWHAHNEWTRNTVHGAIVIYPENGTSYPFPEPDGEEVLIFGSWYTYDVNLAVQEDLTTAVDLPTSDAYTINGQPGDFCNCSKESTYRWQVGYGKTYHLRTINAMMNAQIFFAIAEHNVTVVGMDGAYLKPFETSYVVISPGQTMDLLLTTKNQSNLENSEYYMAARQCYTGFTNFTAFDKTNVTAILEYITNSTTNSSLSPTFPSETLPTYSDFEAEVSFKNQLRSLVVQDVPNNITTHMYITASMNEIYFNTTHTYAASLNNMTWINPNPIDVLQAYYKNMSGFYTEDFPDMPSYFWDFVGDEFPTNAMPVMGTKVKVLEYGEQVEMVFQTANLLNGAEDHPMHLHGHSFYVVGTGDGDFDFEEDPKHYNLVDPPSLNTASVPKSGWLTVRYYARNPGVWLWHCHLDRHLTYGMATVIIVKNGATTETSLRKPPAYMPPCDNVSLIKLWRSEY